MSKWIKRDASTTVKEVVLRNTGLTEAELLSPPKEYFIYGLQDAAQEISNAIMSNITITIYGDYDCDGVTSSAILYRLLKHLGAGEVKVRLPRRFSEGYGLSMKGLDEIDDGLLITIDNGISAVDEIRAAKDKGLRVVVLDHHLRREDGQLPEADVLVDPSAIEGSDFSGYCGAGIAFKLAQLMTKDENFLNTISSLAAIGTVADVMPLIKDNRTIVINGLKHLNSGINVVGLNKLIEQLSLYDCDEGDIGFKFGPIINACGRMHDDGAATALTLLTTNNPLTARKIAEEMIRTNEERKLTVSESMIRCGQMIAEQCLFGETPLVIYTTKDSPFQFHEGIVGIIAGRLAEEFKCPAIVLTETEDGILKGSGRSYGTLHLKELLDTVADKLLGYGGHAGAAGLSVEKDKVEEFRMAIQDNIQSFSGYSPVESDEQYYDLEIDASQIAKTMSELRVYAPYGEGNPKPVFMVKGVRLTPRAGKFYRMMGNAGQSIKLFGGDYDVVAFDMTETYKDLGEPMALNILGNISENRFAGNTTLQIEAIEMEKQTEKKNPSSLAGILAAQMKEKGLN